eukprot:CAMPEP_0181177012 /NCGR_PEP_ID=MMETSP1096-20121128/4937_1 /TAXON_ID=156174 ORGANISM="Chrysochromulina ericina, Strain CCMP281" /NCGR_SAMPLE_ID=MMETSP1096 /ASSEMBLY_ACC=CAM_ASM_000453 /LENGTH=63 /DNA_ID=CAMNT_0023265141 /DNA_START=177 /DNA_END=364 /DNA_ORIENTATION=-
MNISSSGAASVPSQIASIRAELHTGPRLLQSMHAIKGTAQARVLPSSPSPCGSLTSLLGRPKR